MPRSRSGSRLPATIVARASRMRTRLVRSVWRRWSRLWVWVSQRGEVLVTRSLLRGLWMGLWPLRCEGAGEGGFNSYVWEGRRRCSMVCKWVDRKGVINVPSAAKKTPSQRAPMMARSFFVDGSSASATSCSSSPEIGWAFSGSTAAPLLEPSCCWPSRGLLSVEALPSPS